MSELIVTPTFLRISAREKIMPQSVKFDVGPTGYTEKSDSSRFIVNNCNPSEVDLLINIVTEQIPVARGGKDAFTDKKIVRTVRWECPCCYTTLTALVEVFYSGIYEGANVSGLYEVRIGPDYREGAHCQIKVVKLSVTKEVIFQKTTNHLPRLKRP